MDNLDLSETQMVADCQPESSNKRKRRCSSIELNESLKKKALNSGYAGDNPETKFLANNGNCFPENGLQTTDKSTKEEFHSLFMLEEFCDEILYEMFKFLDTWSLMSLMNVSQRFEKIVLDKRLWKNIDLCQQPLPLGILEDMLERSHNKTTDIKLRGPSPCQHIDGEIKHFNQTIRSSLTTRCTRLVTLELYGVTLDFNQISFKDFPQTLKRLVLNTCSVRVTSQKSLFTGIDAILVNLKELAIENNGWFDPYYIMAVSKLPLLRYLSLRGCSQMQEFIPYGSIAARHGFQQLEILDLRDIPLNDSDLQCFNAVETLKEMYLQCPKEESENGCETGDQLSNARQAAHHLHLKKKCILYNERVENEEIPSTSSSSTTTGSSRNDSSFKNTGEALAAQASCSVKDNENPSSSSTSSSSSGPSRDHVNNSEGSAADDTASSGFSLAPNIVPLVGSNAPTRSRFLPRPDHIFVDLGNPNPVSSLTIRNIENHLGYLPGQEPAFQQIVRHNLFWDIVNPLGRIVAIGGQDRLLAEENGADHHLNVISLSPCSRRQARGTISDRGVCCFGRARQPAQQNIIWIRYNNRPSENRFVRFIVRDYKLVTDLSLRHLVQCSPHLIFLDVSGTGVTLAGVQRFKELKPECKVVAEHLLGVMENEKTIS